MSVSHHAPALSVMHPKISHSVLSVHDLTFDTQICEVAGGTAIKHVAVTCDSYKVNLLHVGNSGCQVI